MWRCAERPRVNRRAVTDRARPSDIVAIRSPVGAAASAAGSSILYAARHSFIDAST